MTCPHCGERAIARSSETISAMVREMRYVCTNDESCNFSFVAQLSIVHAVRPSAQPNPAVHIPLSAAFRQPALPALPEAVAA